MSVRRNSVGARSASAGRHQQPRFYNLDTASPPDTTELLPNVRPELHKIIRKLLPQEISLNMHVREVDYIEQGHEQLSGTLYMTTFRLVFSPDNEVVRSRPITPKNNYIGEYDIPLTSIYRITVAPVDTKTGFKSFLNENQIQSETRTFTVSTRDFRHVTFTKCSVTKSNTLGTKQQVSVTKMETYIDALRFHSRFQDKEQLYPYLALQKKSLNNNVSSKYQRGYSESASNTNLTMPRSFEDDGTDFSLSIDDRIRSYLTYTDWQAELDNAGERQWVVDRNKFDEKNVAQQEGPFVRLAIGTDHDGSADLIWHWTHTTTTVVESDRRHPMRQIQQQQFMLVTVPGIGEITTTSDPLRRVTTESSLMYSSHYVIDQPFQRYNLGKFPCNIKRLQTSYERLLEICSEDDDDKWLSKLHSSKWLKYVSKALHGAASLAKILDFKHIELAGSDTDNSCLMSCLVQILLRPKCRTMKGFCELIVREWITRGHRFRERFGQVLYDNNGYVSQESPVFLLFLDAVHQLLVQNPFAFEFTDNLLLELYRSVCFGYHHTFVFNTVRERLEAMQNFPLNLLLVSTFDFSLYLPPESRYALKNDASIFTVQSIPSNNNIHRNSPKSAIQKTVIYPSKQDESSSPGSRRGQRKNVYYLETPKSNFLSDTQSISNGSSTTIVTGNAEQFEYDAIEAPQMFVSDLYVDWRLFNMVLWSKCYCRYDQNWMPTAREQQLSYEIHCLQEDIRNERARQQRTKNRRPIVLDTYYPFGYANSWHPQMLDTRV